MPTAIPGAVFLSYAREDTDVARRVAESLRSAGVEVWFDQSELRGGDDWDQKIRRQICACALFVPLISHHTQVRGKGYFRLEWKLAVEQTHLMADGIAFLAPVAVDDTPENGAVVPAAFMRVHWMRLATAQPTPQFVEQIKRLLAAPPSAADMGVFSRAPAHRPHPAAESAAVACAAPVAPRVRHTVGRAKEAAALGAAFECAADGGGLLLCVSGEPGIGKSTLVEDFLAELGGNKRPCSIARGRCSERLAGTEAYLPFLEALDDLLRGESRETVAAAMKQVAPMWFVQVATLSLENPADARLIAEAKSGSQERMKRELGLFLRDVSGARPLVLFLDDLHWADVSTVDLLAYLATKFQDMRLLIVATYRPSDLLLAKHPLLSVKADWQARGLSRELALEFLPAQDIEHYLALEFPAHRFPPGLAALIHAKTEGSPLFMVDLVRDLKNRQVIALHERGWVLAQSLPEIERELPASVRGMIERKMAQLDPDEKNLLIAASVQGFEFDSAVVAKAAGLAPDDVEQRLERLERVHAFVKLQEEKEFPDRTLTLRYRFVHVLYQNACFASLRPTRRTTLSAAVAQALLGFYGEQSGKVASELAALFSSARDFARAVEFNLLAARQAAAVFANAEAAMLAKRGLDMLPSLPDSPGRASQELSLQLARGMALSVVHGYPAPEAGQCYARARELCDAMEEAPERLPVIFGLCIFYWMIGQHESARQLGEQLVRLSQKLDDRVMQAAAHMLLGNVLVLIGEFTSAREHQERALSFYTAGQHQAYRSRLGLDPGIYSLAQAARVLCLLGYPEQAREKFRQAFTLAKATGDPRSIAFAQILGTIVHTYLRECAQVRTFMEDCIAHCTQHDIGDDPAWARIWGGWAIAELGALAQGIALMQENMSSRRQMGGMISHTEFLTLLAQALGQAGRVDEGLAAVTEAMALAPQMGEGYFNAETRRVRGELLLLTNAVGREREAADWFQQALAIAREQSARLWELRVAMSLARLWQQQGKRDEARTLLAGVYGWFTEGFETTDLKEARGLLAELGPASN